MNAQSILLERLRAKAQANLAKAIEETKLEEDTSNELNSNENNSILVSSNSVDANSSSEPLLSTPTTEVIPEVVTINLNDKQLIFSELVCTRQSCILVGAAGTGKTTAVKHTVSKLLEDPTIPTMLEDTGSFTTPRLRRGVKGIVGCAFTNRAVGNLTKNFPSKMQEHCMTIHALLEYQPTEDIKVDNESGELVKKIIFEPARNASNPLPPELKVIFIEESSMVGTDLWTKLTDAIQHEVQFVFLGDLNQLSPVFGDAILGYKLLQLPVVELTEVYRQALESPIIRLAHRILSGKQLLYKDFSIEHNGKDSEWQVPNKLTIACWKENTTGAIAELTAIKYLGHCYQDKTYDPTCDMVILPFNKSFGSIDVSKGIAGFLDQARNVHPVEIISGYQKCYYAEGDLVILNNEEFVIKTITTNPKYKGLRHDDNLIYNRWGTAIATKSGSELTEESHEDILDQIMQQEDKDTQDEASHKITLSPTMHTFRNKGIDKVISTRGMINTMTLAYATTCHKAQGLEARKVFILLHKVHATLLCREWLYTAVTRAKEELVILCERNSFQKGINTQQIKGNTLEVKAQYFKGKAEKNNTSF